MSPRIHEPAVRALRRQAPLFAALADPTRLALLTKLSGGASLSIASLAEGTRLTRQAITKHLRVLRNARLVRGVRRGRERLFRLEPEPLAEARRALDGIARQWGLALARLKAFVEA
ncbi:MAG: ArsR/SmtB family transcription factor [Phycisphaerales bacterium]